MDKKEKIVKLLKKEESFNDVFEMINLGLNDFTIYDYTNITHIMPMTNDNIKKAAKIMGKDGFLGLYDLVDEEFDTKDDYLFLYDLSNNHNHANYLLSSMNKTDIIDALQEEVNTGVTDESFESIADALMNISPDGVKNLPFSKDLKCALLGKKTRYIVVIGQGYQFESIADVQVFDNEKDADAYIKDNSSSIVNYGKHDVFVK